MYFVILRSNGKFVLVVGKVLEGYIRVVYNPFETDQTCIEEREVIIEFGVGHGINGGSEFRGGEQVVFPFEGMTRYEHTTTNFLKERLFIGYAHQFGLAISS